MMKKFIITSVLFLIVFSVLQVMSLNIVVAQTTNLTVLADSINATWYRHVADLYMQQNPDVSIRVEGIGSHEDLRAAYMMQFISGVAVYDMIYVHCGLLGEAKQYFSPLNDLIEKYNADISSYENLMGIGLHEGTYRVIPRAMGARLWFQRDDLMEEAGLIPPEKYQDILTIAQKLTQDTSGDGEIDIYGYGIIGNVPSYSGAAWLNLFIPHGGRFVAIDTVSEYYEEGASVEPSEWLLSSEAVEMVGMLKQIVDEGLAPWPLGYSVSDVEVDFQAGRLATTIKYNAWARGIEDPEVSQVAGKMSYHVPPYEQIGPHPVRHFGSHLVTGIDNNSTHKEEAFKFLIFGSSYEAQRDVAFNPHIFMPGFVQPAIYEMPEYLERAPEAPALLEILRNFTIRNRYPVLQMEEINLFLHPIVQDVYLGTVSIEEGLRKMYDGIAEILDN